MTALEFFLAAMMTLAIDFSSLKAGIQTTMDPLLTGVVVVPPIVRFSYYLSALR